MTERDREGRTGLHYAALDGDSERVLEFLEAGFDVNDVDRNGFTPLHFAAQAHALDVTRVLLDHGATIDAANRFGNSPLLVAMSSSRGRTDEIVLLCDRGAEPRLRNSAGISAIDLARSVTNFDFTKIFAHLDE